VLRTWWRLHIPESPTARRFLSATLINTFGSGIRDVSFPIFLVIIAHLTATQVGLGLLVAGAVGILFAPTAGRLCDKLGAERALVAGCVLKGLISCCLIFINSLFLLCLIMSCTAIASQVAQIGMSAFIASMNADDRNVMRARINVVSNIGLAVGMGGSAVILAVGTREAFLVAFLLDGVTFLATAAILWRIPSAALGVAPVRRPAPSSGAWATMVKDRRFAAVTALNGFLYFHQQVLLLGLPLWIASTGDLPHIVNTAFFAVNLFLVILLQVRFSMPIRSVASAATAWRRSGVVIAGAFAAMLVVTQLDSTYWKIIVAICGVTLLTFGELWFSAAEMPLSTGLAPDDAKGLYQGIFMVGRNVVDMAGPLLAALFCVSLGPLGWAILAAFYVAFSALGPGVVKWAAGDAAQAEPSQQAVSSAASH
jgi:MFS family permease